MFILFLAISFGVIVMAVEYRTDRYSDFGSAFVVSICVLVVSAVLVLLLSATRGNVIESERYVVYSLEDDGVFTMGNFSSKYGTKIVVRRLVGGSLYKTHVQYSAECVAIIDDGAEEPYCVSQVIGSDWTWWTFRISAKERHYLHVPKGTIITGIVFGDCQ